MYICICAEFIYSYTVEITDFRIVCKVPISEMLTLGRKSHANVITWFVGEWSGSRNPSWFSSCKTTCTLVLISQHSNSSLFLTSLFVILLVAQYVLEIFRDWQSFSLKQGNIFFEQFGAAISTLSLSGCAVGENIWALQRTTLDVQRASLKCF